MSVIFVEGYLSWYEEGSTTKMTCHEPVYYRRITKQSSHK
jgi:hypothetical protein